MDWLFVIEVLECPVVGGLPGGDVGTEARKIQELYRKLIREDYRSFDAKTRARAAWLEQFFQRG